jgi:hypothetical protein
MCTTKAEVRIFGKWRAWHTRRFASRGRQKEQKGKKGGIFYKKKKKLKKDAKISGRQENGLCRWEFNRTGFFWRGRDIVGWGGICVVVIVLRNPHPL